MLRRTAVSLLLLASSAAVAAQPVADPGVRTGDPGAGEAMPGLSANQLAFFFQGAATFAEVDDVPGGLGPRFNLNSCAGCHAQPAMGGTSPATNPQLAVAHLASATNVVPAFVTASGPVREARFVRKPDGTPDGGVHAIFVITGRSDAPGCNILQDDFAGQVAAGNVIFRIPTPVFGGGLVEAISDRDILANRDLVNGSNTVLIHGHENRTGNDGTITRFGWKAQNKSLLVFAGEAYNVEQGVTNEAFQNERDDTPGCVFNGIPEDQTGFDATGVHDVPSDVAQFEHFMRFLAPFPTAPLWGLGQRIFFLHDGRTSDLLQAIEAHRSSAAGPHPASEANAVIDAFDALPDAQRQHLLNFLRSL